MTTPSASPSAVQESAPTGRDEVVAAILDSAADMFAERGPGAASIRDIAARAHVNHGLVFRHFGTKENLVAAVLDYLAAELDNLADGTSSPDEIDVATTRQLRVIARALLDGYPAGQLQSSFPAAARLLGNIRPLHDTEEGARLGAANAMALLLGWHLFEPFVRSATGLHDLPRDKQRESMFTEVGRLVQPH
ncbi:TetR/AcrR family transcriptional regulator [Mycobacterium montefiorense]|uniref:HTH-type transcriptional regulator n=1 Tax=Mycobacterium montefiorense TaxID=154654 RepID=A0AA37PNI8_9MYCO|nr:helix-turn-helix domain-containing protein [Mycobacterium montefiorense]GBG37672.1 putative HTH-type transcriptional regulator [Mycobacterium montefiorense]GKU34809.1 putative HTH-type transcriptional regulator [Mycobacterium montefiorense]GKU40823.1 putative HTH-type transcriptional regulator [Mycobacterium montefiorense]GKU46930.1 putative HTH-type transcriptional regulator [Mycobacterium montefiorense]GKU49050.1 putative HTH-type transcriptional regulator [Mycobacterium montefiorense]